jgi:hypothetical protein
MHEMKPVKQKSFFMNSITRILAILLLQLALVSCADKQDSGQSCEVQLDEQKYKTVADNTNCSNYERASGYLGQAGVSFGNFLKKGASDNLTKTLGIKKLSSPTDYTTGNRGFITKALCLIGANTFLTSSRCNSSSRTRTTNELEISMFANIADFLYLNYGVLDNDSNGTISSTEGEAFTKLKTDGISVDGLGTGLATYNNFEVVIGSNHYVANSDHTKCDPYIDNYTFTPSSNTSCAARALSHGISITEIRPIFKLDNMTDVTADGDLLKLVSMVSELSMISTALSSDFEELTISSENSIRKSLTEGLSKLDNGAKDNNPTADQACLAVTLFDVMFLLVKNASDNSTTSTGLKSGNLISTTDLINAVDSSLSLLPTGASAVIKALPMKSARIVYATNSPATTHTDSYEAAESSLYKAIKNTRSLGIDDSVKSDGKVTFRELICVAEN